MAHVTLQCEDKFILPAGAALIEGDLVKTRRVLCDFWDVSGHMPAIELV